MLGGGDFASFFRPGGRSFALKSCPGGGDFDGKISGPGISLGGRRMVTDQIDTCITKIGTHSYHCRFTQSKPDKESHVVA